MNGKLVSAMAVLMIYPLGLYSGGIDDVISSLKSAQSFDATVHYSVLMSLQDDVDYTLHLTATDAPGDTLAPCDYLIDWSVATPDGNSTGFSAYYAGNAYSFRGDRLLEYHYGSDPTPFMTRGRGAASLPGVQCRAQFAELLPWFIARQLEEIKDGADYRYTVHNDTVVSGVRSVAVDGALVMSGEVMKEFSYIFDKDTLRPALINLENNPGALAEQSITASYSYPGATPPININETMLRERYPDIFDHYRESSYAIENLPGQRLPAFALPTTTRERYSRSLGDKFVATTIIVLIDPKSVFAGATVDAVRSAAASMPFPTDIIWAFVSNNVDEIESVVVRPEVGEHLLMSARPLARDCGASSFPAIIICNTDGTVADVVLGYNNDLSSVVIQKTATAAKQ